MLERGRGKYPSTPLQVKEHLELQWGEHLSPAFYVTRPRLVQSRGSRSVVLREQHRHHLGPGQKSADAT